MKDSALLILLAGLFLVSISGGATVHAAPPVNPQSQATSPTRFTYQGRLDINGHPANGTFDLQFLLYDQASTLVGAPVEHPGELIHDGLYSTTLDFQKKFDGQPYYLQINLRPLGQLDWIELQPRQEIVSVPSAQYAPVSGPISIIGNGDSLTNGVISVQAKSGYAIFATSKNDTTIYASNLTDGVVAYLDGNVTITGTLSQPAINIQLDHPFDPQGETLNLAAASSPQQTITISDDTFLDANGYATVTLPNWFSAVAGDFRYQLTPIGGSAPGLFIASEVSNSQFMIGGGTPGLKVSWQVTGTRQDSYAQAHPLKVEQAKTRGLP